MNPQNPKLSPDGRSVVSGFGDLWLDGQLRPFRGQHPGWLRNDVIGYLDPNGFFSVGGVAFSAVPFNAVAMGGGRSIGTNTSQQTTYVSDGTILTDTYAPAMSPDGLKWACLTSNNELNHSVIVNGAVIAGGEIDDKLSITNSGAVVWSVFEAPPGGGPKLQQTYGFLDGRVQKLQATWDRYEVDPVVVQLPTGEILVISHDDTRTLIASAAERARPEGEPCFGYELQGAKTPHAMWEPSTASLRVVGDLENRLLDVRLDLNAPRVDLRKRPDIEPPADFAITMLPMSARGVTPLSFDATATVTSGGPAIEWTWQYRLAGQLAPWREAGVSQEPRIRFTIDQVGEYEFRVLATDVFGDITTTGRQRLATVLPKETPVPTPTPYDEQFYLNTVRPDLVADYAEAGKPLDANYLVWGSRTAWDQGAKGLTQEASWFLHRNEERIANGLPPL